MTPLIAALPFDQIVGSIGKVIDDLFTSDQERLQAQIELTKLGIETHRIEADLARGQQRINEIEAAHASRFIAGWRPGLGWVGVVGMGYQFVIYPFLTWAWTVMQAAQWVPRDLTAPPVLDVDALWVMLAGILGLGTWRTVERVRGVARAKFEAEPEGKDP